VRPTPTPPGATPTPTPAGTPKKPVDKHKKKDKRKKKFWLVTLPVLSHYSIPKRIRLFGAFV
jgi:hypothetical protein